MSTEQVLENYIAEHPDYWEFDNEVQEVKRLKKLSIEEAKNQNVKCIKRLFTLQIPI